MANKPKNEKLLSSDLDDLAQRVTRLRNRFSVAAFIHESGIEWAETAIDPTNDTYWTHDAFIECYGAGTNN